MTATLVGISYSPWTEKARWALDHHRVGYRYEEHLLMLGMPLLRARLRKLKGDVTVPALISGKDRICDSFKIARFAEKTGLGEPLMPEELLERVQQMNALSDRAINAVRARVLARLAVDPAAQVEAVPGFIPGILRESVSHLAEMGISYIDREFGVSDKTSDEWLADLRASLDELRTHVARAKGGYLLGAFSYADIAASAILQGVKPVSDRYIKLGQATRRCWTEERLATDYAELLEWRDELYAANR